MIPIPVRTNGRIYASVFLFFLFCWPLVLFINDQKHMPDPTVTVCVLIAMMIGSYILNYVRCSTPTLSYWGGVCLMAGAYASGIVEVTALIRFPLLFAVHFWLVLMSLASLFSGKARAEGAYIRACRKFAPDAF